MIKVPYVLNIDFRNLKSDLDIVKSFSDQLGFFEGHGENFNALIDCLSYIRNHEFEVVLTPIGLDEQIVIRCQYSSSTNYQLLQMLISVISEVNQRRIDKDELPPFLLSFSYS